MTSQITLQKIIEITPIEMNNLYSEIEKKLNVMSCSKDDGYILGLKTINSIESIPLIRGGDMGFLVKYEAMVLKPEKEKKIESEITMVFSQGALLQHGPMKLLLPISNDEKENNEVKLDVSKKKIMRKKGVSKVQNYFDILGVSIKATADAIKKAYKNRLKEHSEDKLKMKEIEEAYLILSDKTKKKKYLEELENEEEMTDDWEEYKAGDKILVEITDVKYEKHNFLCICKFN